MYLSTLFCQILLILPISLSKDVVQVLCNFNADLQKRDVFGAMPAVASNFMTFSKGV